MYRMGWPIRAQCILTKQVKVNIYDILFKLLHSILVRTHILKSVKCPKMTFCVRWGSFLKNIICIGRSYDTSF